MTDTVKVPQAGEVQQSGFGSMALERRAETSVVALAEQAKAQVQARYVMAMQRPRDLMMARQRLLEDCKRPKFADAAIYHKPVGDGIEGPSIRMAEAAARSMTNIITSATAIYDDNEKRIVRVSATDLEANITYDRDVTVLKTIERKSVPKGRRVLMSRINSRGDTVHIIEAIDEEILDKEAAHVSKALRTVLLRLIPGDILDEAIEQCYATMSAKDAADPAAAVKAMCDAFVALGVTVEMLVEYLGHPVAQAVPAEIRKLRGAYNAIHAGEATWQQFIAERKEAGGKPAGDGQATTPADATPPSDAPKGQATLGDVAAKAKASREKGKERQPGEDD
jgi:hypothetical protein